MILEWRFRAFYEGLVKWRAIGLKELPLAKRRVFSEQHTLRTKLDQVQAAQRHAARTGAKKAWVAFNLVRRQGSVAMGEWRPVEDVAAMANGLMSQYAATWSRSRMLMDADRVFTAASWPRRREDDVRRMRRKMLFIPRLAICELRRSLDVVLQGAVRHAEFVAEIGRPPHRVARNPRGTARSQTDLRRFFAA